MSTQAIVRQPEGTPTGGQFATTTRAESATTLTVSPAPLTDPGDALAAAMARLAEDRQIVADTVTHLIAAAILKADPRAGYLELQGVETEGGARVYAGRILDVDGQVLHDDVDGIDPVDGAEQGFLYDQVSELTGYYESDAHATWCDAVSDPQERRDGVLTGNPNVVIDLVAAKALYPEGALA